MEKSLSWIHLSDLHMGLTAQGWLWPMVKSELHADLGRMHEKSGPLDLVLFTGDLTQAGTSDQFGRLTHELEELWQIFATLGSSPSLVCVPGNHDLVRPMRN